MSEWFLKEAEKFLDEARECGVNAFTITGGEPMLHRNFMDILTGIYERGMYVEEINTNGYFLRQEVLDQMKERGIRPLMKISFDGIGHHDWLRGRKGAEEDAIRAIRLCRANDFPVMIQTQSGYASGNSEAYGQPWGVENAHHPHIGGPKVEGKCR